MLCKSPVGHYKSSNYKEDITSNRLCGNIEAQPLINLCCVICTSHNIEQKPAWNLVPSASLRATQIAEQDVAIEVRDLTNYPKPKSNLHLQVTHRGVKWMVHVVRYESTKGPIVSTIAEHIGQWRGCVAEPMHKKCFHNAFEVVETPVVHCIGLDRVDDTLSFVAKELVQRKVVEEGKDDQRTQVFPEEEYTVGNLRAKVLEHYSKVVRASTAIIVETLPRAEDNRPLFRSRLDGEGKPLSFGIELFGC